MRRPREWGPREHGRADWAWGKVEKWKLFPPCLFRRFIGLPIRPPFGLSSSLQLEPSWT